MNGDEQNQLGLHEVVDYTNYHHLNQFTVRKGVDLRIHALDDS